MVSRFTEEHVDPFARIVIVASVKYIVFTALSVYQMYLYITVLLSFLNVQ